MKIKLTKVYVNDQERALGFYTDVLGFQKQDDFSNEGYRWLTVVSPDDLDGPQLQLELNSDPAARAFQEATFNAGQPAAVLHSDDVQADYDRMTALGAEFTMPPTDVTAAVIATVDDTSGNLLQLTQIARWQRRSPSNSVAAATSRDTSPASEMVSRSNNSLVPQADS